MYHENPYIDRLLKLVYGLLLLTGAALFCRYLLGPLIPVAVAFLLSCLLCRPAIQLRERTRLPLGLCALLLLAVLVIGLVLAGVLLWRLLVAQLTQLSAFLPEMLSDLQERLFTLQSYLQHRFSWFAIPFSFDGQQSADMLSRFGLEGLMGSLGWAASSLPDMLFTAVFVPAATVLMVCRRARVQQTIQKLLPKSLQQRGALLLGDLRDTLRGWLKAQCLLALGTFSLLLFGFWMMDIQGKVLLALIISLLDALPVLGAGLALLPWATAELVLGKVGRAAGLCGLYAALTAGRSALEPHMMGREAGLSPLLSLISFFLGWKLLGLWGMLLGPAAALILVKWQKGRYNES